jgi:hypothetical protein
MEPKVAHALVTPPAVEPVPAVTGIPPQDVKPTGSGEVLSETEAYLAERAAFLANPEETPAPAAAVTPPAPEAVIPPAEAPPVEGEVEVGEPLVGETPPAAQPPRYRLKPVDAVEAVAFEIRKQADKAGTPITMKDAIAQAEALPQFKKAVPAPAVPLTLPGNEASYEDVIAYLRNAKPTTAVEVQTLTDLAWATRTKAMDTDLNMTAVAQLDQVIGRDLRQMETSVQNQQLNARHAEVARFNDQADASKVRAIELYPDVTIADSALVKKMIEIDAELKASGNPLFDSADKPLKLTQMAANELGMAPRSKAAAASPQPVVKPTRPAQPPFAPGSARTTSASVPTGQLEEKLSKISSVEELEAAKRELASSPA